MERTPFLNASPRIRTNPYPGEAVFSVLTAAIQAKTSWQREIWATKTVMLNSGLTKEQTHMLAAKAIGWQFVMLESLTSRELRVVREFFQEELSDGR